MRGWREVDLLIARAYMVEAPYDFGGHKAVAIRATNEAIRQLDYALHYRVPSFSHVSRII